MANTIIASIQYAFPDHVTFTYIPLPLVIILSFVFIMPLYFFMVLLGIYLYILNILFQFGFESIYAKLHCVYPFALFIFTKQYL